jgi:cold shock CspA family protein
MAQGEILWFDAERGFGFIRPDMGPKDVFVHASALADSDTQGLTPGAKVEFELLQTGDGRLTAQRVILLAPHKPLRAARR